ncbi:FecCD family ABC transporter permease [Niveispirillum cyanobacteriorum]|uniref:ABC transporter permease n=1 Tax=Niveispirillum cyanobacteriorum TaxID=1612173 RepID=A0A2K9NJ36_9PROT|nr:iron ABC transporter permease [Niveispirillum cyanobacteriorum]AUN33104.1 ABC transporter permease [Niveispirillum cyanobacteriorum]GGE88227.1 ABC transporter permease [Niveispirillum cyanobacteriorum]
MTASTHDTLTDSRGHRAVAASHSGVPLLLLLILFPILLTASFLIGPADVPAGDLLSGLFSGQASPAALIAFEIRLPRALLGALVGAGLGMAGAALQGYLRNPLAEPSLIGASSSASLGAVLAIYFGLSATAPLALPVAGMLGAALAMLLIQGLAGRDASVLMLILAGLAVQTLAGSLTSLALNLAPNPHAALEIAFWLLGSLTDRTNDHLLVAAPFIIAGILVLCGSGRALDALGLGERTAGSMGVDLRALRWRIIIGTVLSVGAAVAVTGSIGFVGLVVPHLLRRVTGNQPSRLLWPSALAGACLLLAADILVRLLPTNDELKLGVVTGLIGAPFFFHLLLKTRERMR